MDDVQKIPVLQGEERTKALQKLEAYGFKVKPAQSEEEPTPKNISFFGRRTERMVIG
ncbi:hypothetical protein RB620_25540 [Paenibacillus sp. LHD-117]|uniref:hypothetical protein n=1 Tax=Paenibacillus sp. LHD-117 TaxID=3071412 RepID=UPI0027E01DF6|nr:hypothetical protein [Paenibacillus sp. LHD-117]MDQ6422795.1 hypothetical protein [Paenibacillus sp. LHD-117]